MKLIELHGKQAIGKFRFTKIDDDDYERVSKYIWRLNISKKDNYPSIRGYHKGKKFSLPRFIMNFPNFYVDHKDNDPLNNQKSNLRTATPLQNSRNRKIKGNKTSQYLGVNYIERILKWTCYIKINKHKRHLGYYETEIQAAEIRDLFSLKYYEEFASLNFPEKINEYHDKMQTFDFNKDIEYSSEYYGVSWCFLRKKWRVSIRINNKVKRFGDFDCEVEAAKAYDKVVIFYNLVNRKLNFSY